jgi:hypothetical protein
MATMRRWQVWAVWLMGILIGLAAGVLPVSGARASTGTGQVSPRNVFLADFAHGSGPISDFSWRISAPSLPAPLPASVTVPLSLTLALTTTTVSLYSGDVCAVWGRTVGAVSTVSIPAGPVLLTYSTFSHYTDKPHHEYKYTFAKRVGDSVAAFTLNGQPLPMLYRGELRIEYLPVPVSKRYSYTTYSLVTLEPGDYDIVGDWHFASGEKDRPRRCHLAVTP